MPRGLPDDANVMAYGNVYRSDDITELAARLGSPMTYERRGNVVYLTSFADGIASWIAERSSVDETPTLSGDYSIVGGVSLEIATTDEQAEIMQVYRDLPLFSDAHYGVFTMLSIAPKTWRVFIRAYVYDGSSRSTYELELSPLDTTLKYRDAAGDFVVLDAAMDVFATVEHFHSVGVVFDTTEDVWREITFDGVTYDVADIAASQDVSVLSPRLRISFEVISNGADRALAFLDSVAVAQNPTIVS